MNRFFDISIKSIAFLIYHFDSSFYIVPTRKRTPKLIIDYMIADYSGNFHKIFLEDVVGNAVSMISKLFHFSEILFRFSGIDKYDTFLQQKYFVDQDDMLLNKII